MRDHTAVAVCPDTMSEMHSSGEIGILEHVQQIVSQRSPCEDCALAQHCAQHLVACNQFKRFVRSGDEDPRDPEDLPIKRYYLDLFPEENINIEGED